MLHGDLLGERARLTPEREALVVIETGERFTYGELDVRALSAAHLLSEHLQIGPGDRFGLLAHNCVEFLELFFAAGKSGAIVVPLSTRATVHELEGIVADSGMQLLIFGPEFAEAAAALAQKFDLRILSIADYARERHFDPEARFAPAEPDEIYCLLYTSGTTGRPKGVMIPHRMVACNGYNTAVCWDLRSDDRSPIFTPLYHAGGLGAFLLPVFAAGGTIIVHKGFNVSEIWRVIQQERCTVVLGVPTIWKRLMEAPEFPTADLSHVRAFYSGGAPLPEYIIETYQKRGVVFKQGFGMTEVGVNCFSMTVEDSYRKKGSIGRPMMYTRARVVDAEDRELGADEVGELQFFGPHVSTGYWNNPEATAQAWSDDGWFRSGDSARRDADGFYYIAGRKKEMFISGGVNIYPAEIEAELMSHPSVSDAAVIGVGDETWGEVGVAFVVGVRGREVSREELESYLSTRIGRYKLPKRYIFLDALPRTPYGKVIKNELRKRLTADG
jgi:fatty-acyl-CoA synthase